MRGRWSAREEIKKLIAGAKEGYIRMFIIMRHTAAVHMALEGVPIREIAAVLGHKNSRITEEVYLKFHPDFQREAVKALETL